MFRLVALAIAIGTIALLPLSAFADGIEAAQRDNARYESAARLTLDACATDMGRVEACELRTAALLFQMRAALGDEPDKDKAWKQCASCPALLSAFKVALARGQPWREPAC